MQQSRHASRDASAATTSITPIPATAPVDDLVRRARERWDDERTILLSRHAGTSPESPLLVHALTDQQPALLQRTSGTTGLPRIFAFTREAVHTHAVSTAAVMGISQGTTVGMAIRAGTAYFMSVVMMSLISKSSLIAIDPLDVHGALDTIRERELASFDAGVRFWQVVARRAAHDRALLDALSRIGVRGVGGDPLPRSLEQTYIDLGIPLANGYGLTQAGPNVAIGVNASPEIPGSCGHPLPDVHCKIVDDELLVRSPHTACGELRDGWVVPMPEVTTDEWLRTGDLASIVNEELVPIGRLSERKVTAS